MSFQDLCDKSELIDKQKVFAGRGYIINYANTRGQLFTINALDVANFIRFLKDNFNEIRDAWVSVSSRKQNLTNYEESSYRAIYSVAADHPGLKAISSIGGSQTKPLTQVISKLICYLGGFEYVGVSQNTYFDFDSISKAVANLPNKIEDLDFADKKSDLKKDSEGLNFSEFNEISKPFLLLAGISGTGKTRFIREQAKATKHFNEVYCLTSVRPDWHEPSDLLGYTSRLSASGEAEYVTTDVLQFIARAWRAIFDSGLTIERQNVDAQGDRLAVTGNRDTLHTVLPFWLCLDEMNLAPVEQYFADYLSVLETREWRWSGSSFTYTSDALLKPATIAQTGDTEKFRAELGFGSPSYDDLWQLIFEFGLGIPFNLIVAGTVNMDETTHGFSRKVIDRALTFDFGDFFPNSFDEFFTPNFQNKPLSYPIRSKISVEDLADTCDVDGLQTLAFLSSVNAVLKNTPFELAYRALNELFLAVACSKPKDELTLNAVWDDFMMCKVLPRIEGDSDKLSIPGTDKSLLEVLEETLQMQLTSIWDKTQESPEARPDLYRERIVTDGAPKDDKIIRIECRTRSKLNWMKQRLANATFTSFWP